MASQIAALRKNIASQNLTFCLVNATTGAGLTGATVTTKAALDGTQSAGTGTVTELGSGQYKYVPAQAETNGITVGFLFTATNAVPVNLHCFITSDVIDVNMIQIDGAVTNTPAATLNLLKLNIVNSGGDAIVASSTGSNGSGINASGNGSGAGVLATGGATGIGLSAVGGGTSGVGLSATTTSGHAITAVAGGGNGRGLNVAGQGSGNAARFTAGATGNGLVVLGGATSGHGVDIEAVTSGSGMLIVGADNNRPGIDILTGGAGNTPGLRVQGNGTGAGILTTGGATGAGISAVGQGGGRDILAANSDIFSMTNGVETGLTPLQEMRLTAAASAGKLSGAATTTVVIRNAVADSKDRVTATVDASGNRTAVTTDVT